MSAALDIIPVILSGGAGSRLWPLSRELFPKQLQRLYSDHSLLQETALRFRRPPIVVCNQEHRFIVAEQLREAGLEPRALIVEPFGRNTAPAAAVAALLLAQDNPDALMLIMPSDHMVRLPENFRAAVERAEPAARSGRLVTFGIKPTTPSTAYGYIERGDAEEIGFRVAAFVEKPDLDTARQYLARGGYYWNSGIFLMTASLYLGELQRYRPAMLEQCRQALEIGKNDLFFFRLDEATFSAIKGESIDYAVMEQTELATVIPLEMGWSDIGSWSALWEESPQDDAGNVITGDVVALDSSGSYLRSEKHLLTTIGVKDIVVVATEDAVLVASKEHDQDVKRLADILRQRGRQEILQQQRTYRPWGWFQTIDEGARFKVKNIQVKPGARLSLQKHWHRSEHWVVVTGSALVTCGDKTLLLRENESTFIPAGTVHRLENPGKLPLTMIEVQSGEYVGEDDIVRFEDDYNRTQKT